MALVNYQLLERTLERGVNTTEHTAHLGALLSKSTCFHMSPAGLSTSNAPHLFQSTLLTCYRQGAAAQQQN